MELLYGGLDLHSNNTLTSLLNERDEVVFEQRLPNCLSTIAGALEPYRERIVGLVVESTYNWFWLVDGLQALGYQMHLANPAANVPFSGLKYQDDRGSSRWLARLLRVGILKEGYIYPREERPVRDLLRQRNWLMQLRVSCVLNMRGKMSNYLGRSLNAEALSRVSAPDLAALCGDEDVAGVVGAPLTVMRAAQEQILAIEREVRSRVRVRPEYERVQTVWGIGPILVLGIMLETGPISRFAEVGDYVSYCRCAPSQRLSNFKPVGKGNPKNGNAYLAWMYVEAAIAAARHYPAARAYLQSKTARRHRVVAIKALAGKLCAAAYWVMREQVDFDASRLFASLRLGRDGQNRTKTLVEPDTLIGSPSRLQA